MHAPSRSAVPTLIAAALLSVTACGDARTTGTCGAYVPTPGTARITAVETPPATENSCKNDPVKVVIDFVPQDPARAELAATGWSLTLVGGLNPPRSWVTASGLTVGSDHPAVRSDQASGPCSPIIIELSDADEQAGLAACY